MLSTSLVAGALLLEPFAAASSTVTVVPLTEATRNSAESSRTVSSVPTLTLAASAALTVQARPETLVAVMLRPAIWSSSHSCFCWCATATRLKLEMKRGSFLMTVERMSERSRFLFWKL